MEIWQGGGRHRVIQTMDVSNRLLWAARSVKRSLGQKLTDPFSRGRSWRGLVTICGVTYVSWGIGPPVLNQDSPQAHWGSWWPYMDSQPLANDHYLVNQQFKGHWLWKMLWTPSTLYGFSMDSNTSKALRSPEAVNICNLLHSVCLKYI